MVSKPSPSAEEEQAVANVYRLHKPEQSLPQEPVCSAKDRSGDRLHSRMRAVELLRCLFRLSPDQAEPGGQIEDRLHHTIRSLLLPDHDVRLEECRRHLSALHAEMPPQATRQKRHVYVDDVVVKTEKRGTLLEDLKETFENLR